MRTNKPALQLAAFAAVLISASTAWAGSAPTGLWIDHTGRGGVEITKCGGRLCGHIAWLKDAKNSEVCGVQVIGDAKPMRNGTWDRGWIFDPDTNSKYDVELKPIGSKKLRVVGYAGTKFLSETMMWKRAPVGLTKCSKPGSGKAAADVTEKAVKTSQNVTKADTPASTTKEAKPTSNESKVKTANLTPKVKTPATIQNVTSGGDAPQKAKTAAETKTKDNRKGTLGKMAQALVDMSEDSGELPDEIKTILRRWGLDR